MIQAKELRIGNLVTIENKKSWPNLSGKPMKVIGIEERLDRRFPKSRHTVKLEEYSQFEEFISYIPLTPKILERIGEVAVIATDDSDRYWKIGGLLYSERELVMQKGLHWLQNFHYFRTGEELEIKELQTTNK